MKRKGSSKIKKMVDMNTLDPLILSVDPAGALKPEIVADWLDGTLVFEHE